MPHFETSNTGNITTENGITPKLVDWLLYNLDCIREACAEIEPKTPGDIIYFIPRSKGMANSKVESIAVKRAMATRILDVIDRAIRTLPSRSHKAIYRLKWRRGKTVREISDMFFKDKKSRFFSTRNIQNKVAQVRDHVALLLQEMPDFESSLKLHKKLHIFDDD